MIDGFAATTISLWLADSPSGPWMRNHIYNIPAPYNDTSKLFCYAAKAHPELERTGENELVFSFICNAFDVDTLFLPGQATVAYLPLMMRVAIQWARDPQYKDKF